MILELYLKTFTNINKNAKQALNYAILLNKASEQNNNEIRATFAYCATTQAYRALQDDEKQIVLFCNHEFIKVMSMYDTLRSLAICIKCYELTKSKKIFVALAKRNIYFSDYVKHPKKIENVIATQREEDAEFTKYIIDFFDKYGDEIKTYVIKKLPPSNQGGKYEQ